MGEEKRCIHVSTAWGGLLVLSGGKRATIMLREYIGIHQCVKGTIWLNQGNNISQLGEVGEH